MNKDLIYGVYTIEPTNRMRQWALIHAFDSNMQLSAANIEYSVSKRFLVIE